MLDMEIARATAADVDDLVAALAALHPQLASGPAPGRAQITAMVESPVTFLLIARDPARGRGIVGTLTLTLFPLPQGLHGQINAVVVDAAARGRGIGEALTREALRIARDAGAYRVSLTSRNTRAAAHRLYLRVGFERLDSSVFRLLL
jgi:ribosomal protein S18 acetylase RimI-like enzyme